MKFKRVIAGMILVLMLFSASGCNKTTTSSGGLWGGNVSKPNETSNGSLALEDGWLQYKQNVGTPKTGALDFSYLNEMPAGKRGHVIVKDGDFYFEDGTRVRFFGVNLAFSAATPDKALSERIAAELASQGVNLARIHGIDCSYSGIVDYISEDQPQLDPNKLDKLDYLVYCLKQKGIYVHLDTNAGRILKESQGFTAAEVDYAKGGTLRAARYIDERIVKIETDFVKEYLTHKNPYTGMTYIDDPAVAVVQYTNESSVTWFNTYNENNVFHSMFQTRFNAWLADKYKTRSALKKAWTNADGDCALASDEDPSKGTVRCSEIGGWGESTVRWSTDYDSVQSAPRYADFMSFLYDVQSNVFLNVYQMLRNLGYKSAINMSNIPRGAVEVKLNSLGDVMEENAYWNLAGPQLPANCGTNPMSSVDVSTSDTIISNFARASVTDKPFIATEWNSSIASDFRADAVFQVAAYGSLQDWDGFCLFTYTFEGDEVNFDFTTNFDSFLNSNIDPAMWGQFGMAAAIFRLGLVKPAKNSIEYVITNEDMLASSEYYGIMPRACSFVSKYSVTFVEETYNGDADLVISSGNTSSGDYTKAKNLLLHSDNPFNDAQQHNKNRESWLTSHKLSDMVSTKLANVSVLKGKNRIIINEKAGSGFLAKANSNELLTQVMRNFGLISENEGWLDKKVVSDTGEIVYDYGKEIFSLNTDRAVVAAGKIAGKGEYLTTDNDLACIALFSMTDKSIAKTDKMLVYAMGRCTNYGIEWEENTLVSFGGGPMIYQDVRGTLNIPSSFASCTVWGLDHNGNRAAEIKAEKTLEGFAVSLGGYCNYEIAFK